MRTSIFFALTGMIGAVTVTAEPVPFQLHGQAWSDVGRMVQASDPGSEPLANPQNMNGTMLQSLGAQLTVDAELGPNWTGMFGAGVYQVSHSLGSIDDSRQTSNFLGVSMFRPYVAQANLTYFLGERTNPWFSVTAGNFAYKYNTDAQNLGLYLLRGPVYPGLLMSGFQEFETDTSKATQTGFKVHNVFGNFSHDLLLVQERLVPPTFDWSVAYVAKYRAFEALEIGGGANFYRLISNRKTLETPGRLPNAANAQDNTPNYTVDTSGGGSDTTYYTHQGVKLMAMFSLDLKRWMPLPRAGAQDFKLYGEAAIIGVKDYGTYYDDITERIPVMVGFNVPTFGILDLFSVEVEWYGTPYRDDMYNLGNPNAILAPWMFQNSLTPSPASPVPMAPGAYADSTRDNWKWSVLLQKKVARHIQFTGQVANDHYRSAPVVNSAAGIGTAGGSAVMLTRPSDWYFMGRLGFYF